MKDGLDQEEICNVATDLASGLISAEEYLPYLAMDPSISRVTKLLKGGLSIACCDFDQTDYDSDSGFKWLPTDKICVLNKRAIQMIFDHASSLPEYMQADRQQILNDVIGIYLFHELFHIPQGIPEFATVQKIKAAMGKDKLGELDTHADFVGARAYAALIAFDYGADLEAFGNIFYKILELSYSIGLKSFGIQPDASHKVNRALSIFLGRERIQNAKENGTLSYQHFFAVHCFLSVEAGLCVAYLLEGDERQTTLVLHELDVAMAKELQGTIQFGNLRHIEKQFKDARFAA